MKNTKKCPKCGCNRILRIKIPFPNYHENYIPLRFFGMDSAAVIRYVCTGCGYSEEWIDKDDIPRLDEKYPQIFNGRRACAGSVQRPAAQSCTRKSVRTPAWPAPSK